MFLAVTPIEEFWDKSDDLLFIGPWCARYDRRADWSGLPHRFLPDPWLDFGRFKSAADYCQGSASRLLVELTGYLNGIHGTGHDERYWRVLLDPWLTYHIEQMYDHFVHVEDAFRLQPGLRTILLDPDCYETPRDTADFVRMKLSDRFHLQMFSHVIAARGAGFPTRRLPSSGAAAPPDGGLKALAVRAAAPGLRALRAAGAGRMLLSELGLSRGEQMRLAVRSGLRALPFYAELPDSARPAAILDERRLGLSKLRGADEFEKAFVAALPRHLPTILLEGYAEARRATLASLPRAPKIVFSSLGWHYADPFKFAAAECAARGSRLWGIAHGNSYGLNEFIPAERFERAVCDRYFGWGWAETEADPRLRNLPSPFLSRVMSASQGDDLLFASMNFDFHNMRLIRDSNGSGAIDAIERQARFFRALPEPARGRALMRLIRHDAGWRHRERLADLVPGIRFDDASIPFGRRMREARLVVVDYPSMPMVEAFAADVPCLVTWAPDAWTVRPSARPFLDALRRTGILFDSPEDAAAAAARAYEDPRAWWDEPARRAARLGFTRTFALSDPDWMSAWLREIRAGLEEPS